MAAIDLKAFWDNRELSVFASPRGLVQMVSLLRGEKYGSFKVSTPPFVRSGVGVTTIHIARGDGLLKLEVEQSMTRLSGDDRSLLLLAKNLENLRLLWAQGGIQHFHFDCDSNPILVGPESAAFIVSPMQK